MGRAGPGAQIEIVANRRKHRVLTYFATTFAVSGTFTRQLTGELTGFSEKEIPIMQSRLKLALLLGAVLATGASAAIAEMSVSRSQPVTAVQPQQPSGGRGQSRFLGEYDLNRDGRVTRAEFNQAVSRRYASATGGGKAMTAGQFADDATRRYRERETQYFRRADWNGDGRISLDEYSAPLRAKYSAIDRRGSGVISCAPRNRPQVPTSVVRGGDQKTPARRRGPSRGLCPSNDLNMDGKVTRQEFDKSTSQKFAAAAHAGRALSFDQFMASGAARFREVNARIFRSLDVNRDGHLSPAEFAVPLGKVFARIDANRDGVITRGELQAPRQGGFGAARGRFPYSAPR
jgi:Ca2+-binding EF-hand superfamily protein